MDDRHTHIVSSWLGHRAYCQCGWIGKRRWLRGSAVLDAIEHGTNSGHLPS